MTKAYQSYAIGHLQGQGYLIDLFDCGSIQKGTCNYFLAGGCWVVEKELRNDQAIHRGTPHHTTPTSLCQFQALACLLGQWLGHVRLPTSTTVAGCKVLICRFVGSSDPIKNPTPWDGPKSSAWEILGYFKNEKQVIGEFIALSLDLTSSGG